LSLARYERVALESRLREPRHGEHAAVAAQALNCLFS
jgi:hypothetical protein